MFDYLSFVVISVCVVSLGHAAPFALSKETPRAAANPFQNPELLAQFNESLTSFTNMLQAALVDPYSTSQQRDQFFAGYFSTIQQAVQSLRNGQQSALNSYPNLASTLKAVLERVPSPNDKANESLLDYINAQIRIANFEKKVEAELDKKLDKERWELNESLMKNVSNQQVAITALSYVNDTINEFIRTYNESLAAVQNDTELYEDLVSEINNGKILQRILQIPAVNETLYQTYLLLFDGVDWLDSIIDLTKIKDDVNEIFTTTTEPQSATSFVTQPTANVISPPSSVSTTTTLPIESATTSSVETVVQTTSENSIEQPPVDILDKSSNNIEGDNQSSVKQGAKKIQKNIEI